MALNLDLRAAASAAGSARTLVESSELDPAAIEAEVRGFLEQVTSVQTVDMVLEQCVAKLTEEATRILAPGGRYAIHEMGFRSETPVTTSKAVEKALSRTIKVGARPLTLEGWTALLEEAGFDEQYRLKPDAQARKDLPDFADIPLGKIGRY